MALVRSLFGAASLSSLFWVSLHGFGAWHARLSLQSAPTASMYEASSAILYQSWKWGIISNVRFWSDVQMHTFGPLDMPHYKHLLIVST